MSLICSWKLVFCFCKIRRIGSDIQQTFWSRNHFETKIRPNIHLLETITEKYNCKSKSFVVWKNRYFNEKGQIQDSQQGPSVPPRRVVAKIRWRRSTQFRWICLFPLDSTQEIHVPSDSQETSLQTYTCIFSLEAKMVEILMNLNWKWKWGSKKTGHYKSEFHTLPSLCKI